MMGCDVAKTRKEVVAKFDAAKDDEGYSRIMKSQSLNPDHSEQQTQLRRSIRVRLPPSPSSKASGAFHEFARCGGVMRTVVSQSEKSEEGE